VILPLQMLAAMALSSRNCRVKAIS
jgi:hypothetical protein